MLIEVRESIADIFAELPCLSDLENPGQLPVREVRRYWRLCFIDFHNSFVIYVFEVKEFISDIPTELPCSVDLENPGQLPVREILMILSYKYFKFSQFMFPRSRNPLVILLPSYHPWVTSNFENLGQLPVQEHP